jgi:hypothetical protein
VPLRNILALGAALTCWTPEFGRGREPGRVVVDLAEEVRGEVERLRRAHKLTSQEREVECGTDGWRRLWIDASGRARALHVDIKSGDSTWTAESYYDRAGRLRLLIVRAYYEMSEDGHLVDRVYLHDGKVDGERVSAKGRRSGQLWFGLSEVVASHIAIDARLAFEAPCPPRDAGATP